MTGIASTVFGGPASSTALVAALLVDATLGVWVDRFLPDPRGLSRRFVISAERRLNRPDRSRRDRLIRGFLVVVAILVVAGAVGLGVRAWANTGSLGGSSVELAILVLCLRGRAEWSRVRGAARGLEARGAKAAHPVFAAMTRRTLDERDGHAMLRVGVERLARAFDRGLVAPAFWFLLGGAPGVLIWAAIDGADRGLGAPGVRTADFGLTAARLDDALGAIPARLSALLIVAAAGFVGGASARGAARTALRDARRSPSFNMGWPIAAAAGGLGLSLCGPRREGAVVINEAWLGDGRARVAAPDVGRALILVAVAALILALIATALTLGLAA